MWASVQECPPTFRSRASGLLTVSELAGAGGRPASVGARTGGRHGRMRSRVAPAPAAGTAWPRATSQPNARNRDFGRGVEGNPLDDRKRPTAGLACHRRETPQGLTSEAWRWYGTVCECSGMSPEGMRLSSQLGLTIDVARRVVTVGRRCTRRTCDSSSATVRGSRSPRARTLVRVAT